MSISKICNVLPSAKMDVMLRGCFLESCFSKKVTRLSERRMCLSHKCFKSFRENVTQSKEVACCLLLL